MVFVVYRKFYNQGKMLVRPGKSGENPRRYFLPDSGWDIFIINNAPFLIITHRVDTQRRRYEFCYSAYGSCCKVAVKNTTERLSMRTVQDSFKNFHAKLE